jgi:hypothetical protein
LQRFFDSGNRQSEQNTGPPKYKPGKKPKSQGKGDRAKAPAFTSEAPKNQQIFQEFYHKVARSFTKEYKSSLFLYFVQLCVTSWLNFRGIGWEFHKNRRGKSKCRCPGAEHHMRGVWRQAPRSGNSNRFAVKKSLISQISAVDCVRCLDYVNKLSYHYK